MIGVHGVSARELEALLILALRERVFPGAVCAVGRLADEVSVQQGSLRVLARGGVLAPGEAEVSLDTPYDLASLTKSFVAITALRLVQRGVVDLQTPVWRVLTELEGTLGGGATLAELLSHRAGLLPWSGLYQQSDAPFGSEERKRTMLRAAAGLGLRAEDPHAQVRSPDGRRGNESVYSDLGYLLAGETLARAAGQPLDELVRREVTAPLGMDTQVYYAASLPEHARESLRQKVAPTEQCVWRGGVVRGEVHDENAHAFGGVAGHAGLFGTASAVMRFGLALLLALEGRSSWLDQALLRWALAPRDQTPCGYVLGFDTKSREGSSAGELFSERSFGHLGFTGTSIWCDPTRRLCAVLLSNRVHPTRENIAIRSFRPRFHDAAAELHFSP
jgi:CubicO group peptidase (beta-lactamase class C family)